jgi:hypothetical protein
MAEDAAERWAENPAQNASDLESQSNVLLMRDVLRWVAGAHWGDLVHGPNAWLCAFLLDDPPKLDDTPPEVN